MAFSRCLAASILLFSVLVMASEMGTTKVVEARECGSRSTTFTSSTGQCVPLLDGDNCRNTCKKNEGADSGKCIVGGFGFASTETMCLCTRACCS